MSTPDIIKPIGNGMFACVWIDAIEAPRQADDSWKIQLPLRASLCLADGTLVRDGNGNEIAVTCPIPNINAPFADYAHHPEVMALYAALRDVSIRIASGDLAPLSHNQDDATAPAANEIAP